MKYGSPADDPAFPAMTMDILGNVLSRADNPSELAEYLTEEIRSLTGARCVVFIECPGRLAGKDHRVAGVNPAHRRSWAESLAACRLYELVHQAPVTTLWRAGDGSVAAALLHSEGYALSMAIPLNVGARRVGGMLLLGLPDQAHLDTTVGILNTLATVVALVMRNALLYERQDQVIRERTRDLQASHEALRESENRYRGLFENSPVALWELDCSKVREQMQSTQRQKSGSDTPELSGIAQLIHIKALNQAALDLIGAQSLGAIPSDLSVFFTDASLQFLYERLRQHLRGDARASGETVIRRLTGETSNVAVMSIVPPGQEATWSSMITAVIDITERTRLELEIARAKRLESAGRLAGQIAHDFNNLLSPLVTYPEMIRELLPPDFAGCSMLEDMEQAALQITEINQELLTLGRRGHYKQSALNLNDLIESALRTATIPPLVKVEKKLAPDLQLIAGGPGQLTRVLNNLIVNAVEAMEGIGQLSISTGNTYLDHQLRRYNSIRIGEYVCLAVSDSGPGVPADNLDLIFEPFFTTKVSDRRRGTGLGLSVVHAVVEDHKGYVDVCTSLGGGTTFYLYFPIMRPDLSAQPAAVGRARGSGQRILVADDDPLQLRIARSMLESLGYTVQTVESGEEAVAAVSAHVPDLAILDMIMAGIDGTETLIRIRKIAPNLPAIIFSGFAASDRVNAALAMGSCDFLAKPVRLDDCARAVHSALAGISRPR
ncbi:MAG: response regulator [candidate division Zixibacteria bacterium]|nr:response regulator [candidate division Zixibacteria bacterium]